MSDLTVYPLLLVLLLTAVAALWDLRTGEIPKALIKAQQARDPNYKVPANWEANHNIPASVAKNSALAQRAEDLGLWSIDNVDNGSLLPIDTASQSDKDANLIHRIGKNRNHPQYNKQVAGALGRLEKNLVDKYGGLDKVPDSVLKSEMSTLQAEIKARVDAPPAPGQAYIDNLDFSDLPP